MRRLVREGKKNLRVRQTALSIVESIPEKDHAAEVKEIHEFVRDGIRYVRDINGVETIAEPDKLLQIGAGDCDDKSVLLASLLESIGYPTRFVAIGRFPGRFSHVLVEVNVNGKWVPLETTEQVNVGWFPPGRWNVMMVKN